MDGLCECYFIGGEWDGVRKRTAGGSIVKVRKTKVMEHKIEHYFFKEDTVTTTIDYEEDVYYRIMSFSDGVLVYRLREDCSDVDANDDFVELERERDRLLQEEANSTTRRE